MKKKIVKGLSVAMAITMAAGMLSACGGSSSNSGSSSSAATTETGELDTSKEVEISMYVISDRPAGQDIVDEAINKMTKEKLNCTVKINWIGWAEYANKYPLLFSSGEEFDMAYCATWLNFASLAQKGAFKNLDELWPTYAPDNYALATESAFQEATVDGHYYCVPTLLGTYNGYGAIYRGDLYEESGLDVDMSTFDGIEAFGDWMVANHPEMEYMDQYSTSPEWSMTYMLQAGYNMVDRSFSYMWIDVNEEHPTVKLITDYPEYDEYLQYMKRFNEKGFFSKSALSDTDSTKLQNGKAALKVHNIDTWNGQVVLHPEWNMQFANMVQNVAHLPFTQDCMVISNTSKNPERALALWNLITTDQEMYDTFYYGVKGTTYELDDEGNFELLDTDKYSASSFWAARTTALNRNQVGSSPEYGPMKEKYEEMIAANGNAEKYAAFSLDTSSMETEIAAVNNVIQQYKWPLDLAYTDIVSGKEELVKQLDVAGVQTILEKAQEQLDAYIASLG